MLGITPTNGGAVKLSSEPLGRGGEGSVYAVLSHSIAGIPPAEKLVAKIYHKPEEENRRAKLKAMVTAPVSDKAVAWPQAIVLDQNKVFLGYLMIKLERASNREWLYLANAKERNRVAPDFDTRYAFMAIRNLAAAILAVHGARHLVGDINESNIFVNADASVLIVDSDSMQIKDARGVLYPCVVGKQEYTAPELSYGSFRENPRTSATDVFAFAVASFQLLTGGATPHQGSFDPSSPDDPISTVERIRKGILPSLEPMRAKAFGFSPRPGVPVAALPAFMRKHLLSFLSPEPLSRETSAVNLESLISEIDGYAPTLVRCSNERLHWHEPASPCLWCAESLGSGVDPWAASVMKNTPAQVSLPSIGFRDDEASAAINRATPAIAGQNAHQASGAPVAANLQQLIASNPALYALLSGSSPASSPKPAPVSNRPKKVKGKVTVEYADGSWGVRPRLGVMLRQSPKLFIWAFKEETPSLIKFWWPVERKIPSPVALIAGFMLSLAFVYLNFNSAFSILYAYIPSASPALILSLAFIPGVTSLLATASLLGSAFRDRAKTKKQHGDLTGFEEESAALTIARFLPVALFYGVPAVVLGTIAGMFTLIRSVVKA